MIGFGNEPNLVFALTFRQCCREVPARRRHGGLGISPASAFVIQMLCLRQRRHRRRWYLKGADNTPYEKIGDEVRSLADEVPFDIPDSWEWVRIRSLGEIVRGSGIKRNETVQQGLPCVRYGELYTTYQTSFTSAVSFIAPDLYEKCKHFSYGDVLMTLTGENKPDIAKAVAYLGTEPIAASGDLAFWTQHGMNPLFLSYIMASPYIIARKVASATGDIIVHISGDKLGTILLPVPPLAEQERIVACIQEAELVIENYAIKATALQKLQDSFPEALKKSILQEAVQGKLVPQDPSDEPAEALLERIRAEKQRLIKEGKIKKDKHESVIFRRDNSHYEKLDGIERCIDDEIPFDLPKSWEWVRFFSVVDIATNLVRPEEYADYMHIAPDNIEKATGTLFECHTVQQDKVASPNHLFYKGQIIYSKIRPLLRKAVIAPFDGLCSADMYPLNTAINRKYLLKYMLSDAFNLQVATAMSSRVKMPKINQDELSKILIPIPPMQEQERIVSKIEELFDKITLI